MAKAASPIRLQEDLMASAKLTASSFHRSTAEQIEYWAELGRSVASTLDPDVLLSVSSGLSTITIAPAFCEPLDLESFFQALENDRKKGRLSQEVSACAIKYQVSKNHPGYLEKIDSKGSVTVGQFENGPFIPFLKSNV